MKGKQPAGIESFMQNPMALISTFIKQGEPQFLKGIIDKIDLLKFGGDMMQQACVYGKDKIVNLLVAEGVDILNPPETVTSDPDYRRSPFVIQAAKSGDIKTLEAVLNHGGTMTDCGCICLSKKKKNVVISNVIGCAAYHGNTALLKYVLERMPRQDAEIDTMEHQDKYSKGVYQRELSKYTPLMLAVAGGDSNLDSVKALLQKGVDFKVEDEQSNSVLHIAAMNGCNQVMDYLAKNLKIELFQRNKLGETALSICQAQKNVKGIQIMNQFKQDYDKSRSIAEELMDELVKEDESNEEAKAKRKQKKWRNKINRIAKAENISPEEVEKRLEQEEKMRQEEELEQKKAEEEQERQAQIELERRKEEVRRQREEMRRQEMFEQQAELARAQEEAREAREERVRLRNEKKERYRSAAREQRREQNKSRTRQQQADEANTEDARPSLKKERVRSNARQQNNNTAQHEGATGEPQKAVATGERTPRHQQASEDPKERRKSKSMRRNADELPVENTIIAGEEDAPTSNHIVGLGGEMALQTALSKKAQQRLKKKLKKQQEEQDEQRQILEKVALEKAEAARMREQEEQKRRTEEQKATKLKRKQEKEARNQENKKRAEQEEQARLEAERQAQDQELAGEEVGDAHTEGKPEKKRNRRNNKKDKENQATASNVREDAGASKKQMMYRAKTAASTSAPTTDHATVDETQKPASTAGATRQKQTDEIVNQMSEQVNKVAEPEAPSESSKQSKNKAKKEQKKQALVYKEKKQDPEVPAKEETAVIKDATASEQKVEKPDQSARVEAQKTEAKPAAKADTPANQEAHDGSAFTESQNAQVLALQQMLYAKEKELVTMQRHIDKQESKLEAKEKENTALKEQLNLSSNENTVKQSFNNLNIQFKQQVQLNRLQASQILEFEQALWQAQKQREEAEDKLQEYMQTSAAPTPTDGGIVQRTAHDMRAKHIQIRDMQQTIDCYQGKATAINALSKAELTDLQDELTAAKFKIEAALQNK